MGSQPVSIPPRDRPRLREVSRVLRGGPAKLVGKGGEHITLPKPLASLLRNMVRDLEDGRQILLLPQDGQLTTQQAGELLGMSRPYIIQLLDAGEMPYRLVGKHRRIALADVVAYGERRAAARRPVLDRMAREAFEAGLYDDPAPPKRGRKR